MNSRERTWVRTVAEATVNAGLVLCAVALVRVTLTSIARAPNPYLAAGGVFLWLLWYMGLGRLAARSEEGAWIREPGRLAMVAMLIQMGLGVAAAITLSHNSQEALGEELFLFGGYFPAWFAGGVVLGLISAKRLVIVLCPRWLKPVLAIWLAWFAQIVGGISRAAAGIWQRGEGES